MYYLTRGVLKFNRLGALFSALSLTLCSWMPNQLFDGNFTKIYYYFVPLTIACILKARIQRRFIAYSSILLAVIFLQAGLSFAAISLFLTILLLFFPEEKPLTFGNVKYLFISVILALLLSSIKAISMAELLSENIRKVDYSDLQRYALNSATLFDSLFRKNYHVNSTIYAGYATIFLAATTFIFDFKKIKGLLFVVVIILAIIFGPNSLINLSALIWKLPIFQSMAKLDKYYSFFLAFLLCLAAGHAFGLIEKTRNKKLFTALAFLIIFLNTYDVFKTNISFHRNIFPDKPLSEKRENKEFFQYFILNNNKERDAGSYLQYAFLKANKGIINWYGNIYLKESAIPKFLLVLERKSLSWYRFWLTLVIKESYFFSTTVIIRQSSQDLPLI